MSALRFIKGLLGLDDSEEQQDGLAVLESILNEREATLNLEAEYIRPTVNTMGQKTAVFPISLYHEGDAYGAHAKEFVIPDDGLDDSTSDLALFLAEAHGKSPDEVEFEDIAAIEGAEADAWIDAFGDVLVETPILYEETPELEAVEKEVEA